MRSPRSLVFPALWLACACAQGVDPTPAGEGVGIFNGLGADGGPALAEDASAASDLVPSTPSPIPGAAGSAAGDAAASAPQPAPAGLDAGADAAAAGASSRFAYVPSNVALATVDFRAAPSATLNCGVTQIDTSGAVSFQNWCGAQPTAVTRTQAGGAELVVIALEQLSLAAGSTLRVVGARPVAFVVAGPVSVAGAVDASATGPTPGAGGNVACGTSAGGDGSGAARLNGGGGGGGGFATQGGQGGDDRGLGDSQGGSAGATRGSSTLVPLLAGCNGGHGGGSCAGEPGAGAGAIQISAGGTLQVRGSVRADGGNGAKGCGNDAGGTGAGSGGAILLEAASVDVSGATLSVSGGSGGKGQSSGDGGKGASATSAAANGEKGSGSGGGGGGGGLGRIQLRALQQCTGC